MQIQNNPELLHLETNFSIATQESLIKQLVMSLIQPVLEYSKKNIEHNAKKNEKFFEMNQRIDGLIKESAQNQKSLEEMWKLPKDIQETTKLLSTLRTEYDGRINAQVMAI